MKFLIGIFFSMVSIFAIAQSNSNLLVANDKNSGKNNYKFNINEVIYDALIDIPGWMLVRIPDDRKEQEKKGILKNFESDVRERGFNASNLNVGLSSCRNIIFSPLEIIVPGHVKYEIKEDELTGFNEWVSYKMSFWNANATLRDSQLAVKSLNQRLVRQFGNKLICAMVVSKIANLLQYEYEAGKIKSEDVFYTRAVQLKDPVIQLLSKLSNGVSIPAEQLAKNFQSYSFSNGQINDDSAVGMGAQVINHPDKTVGDGQNSFDMIPVITYLINDFDTKTTSDGIHLAQIGDYGLHLIMNEKNVWSKEAINGKSSIVTEQDPNYKPKHRNRPLSDKEEHELLD